MKFDFKTISLVIQLSAFLAAGMFFNKNLGLIEKNTAITAQEVKEMRKDVATLSTKEAVLSVKVEKNKEDIHGLFKKIY